MGDFVFMAVYYVLIIPGYLFALTLSKFKRMGNGNESTEIEFAIWAAVFGIVVWVFVITEGIWIWNNISISLLVK